MTFKQVIFSLNSTFFNIELYQKTVMKRRIIQITLIEILIFSVVSCVGIKEKTKTVAPGAPGNEPTWAYAGKLGIGTSYEAYKDGNYTTNDQTGKVSKVWFSLAKGIVTETMYGLIHEAQLKKLKFIIVGDDFIDFEDTDTDCDISYLHTDESGCPLSLAYKVITKDKDGLYEIEKHIFTNPEENALFVKVIFKSQQKGITPYLYLNPHVKNTGIGDFASASSNSIQAWENDKYLTLLSDKKFKKASVGFVGTSDGISDLKANKKLTATYNSTGKSSGNIAGIAQLAAMTSNGTEYEFVIGFGDSEDEANNAASVTLKSGYNKILAQFNGEGKYIGWEDYVSSLSGLKEMKTVATDGGKLAQVSAMVLKAQEDKTNAGALIASLSNPWGDTTPATQYSTGYKGVWPRDFFQCAMAFLALGDKETPLTAFEYLPKVQVTKDTPGNKGATGWFLQKNHVDGTLEWMSVQLDQTAMPIMLGWQLWKKGILSDNTAKEYYNKMIKSAADFLVDGGEINLDWNHTKITPPKTQQERWEEQAGYSPSTTAAIISGLVTAAEFAKLSGDNTNANKYLAAADNYENNIENYMFTTTGKVGDGKYFMRITANNNPNDNENISANNGRPAMNETLILDGGFLELVRYGVRDANAESIIETIEEFDMPREENLQTKYNFKFEGDENTYPGWRRYGNDGYGEATANGANYGSKNAGHRGRVWPFFTGERAHYELAKEIENSEIDIDELRNTYVKAMEYFANEGMMLPEQVYDGVGVPSPGYKIGEGTNGATPLAWTHAEYLKMLRSLYDQKIWDKYSCVAERYSN